VTATVCRVCGGNAHGGFACKACVRHLERTIGDMPALLAELEATISRQSHTYRAARAENEAEQPVRYGPRTRPRVDIEAVETRWDVQNTLTTWARHLAGSRGDKGPTFAIRTRRRRLRVHRNRMEVWYELGPWRENLDLLVGWLLTNIDSVRFDEAADQIIDEIGYARRQLEAAIDRSPERYYAGPCQTEHADSCCVRDLYWRHDGSLVCDGHRGDHSGCRTEHSVSERQEWLRDRVAEQLWTLDDALDALALWRLQVPPRGVIGQWVRSGRLPVHGLTRRGEPTYSLIELVTLVQAYRPHAFAPRRKRIA